MKMAARKIIERMMKESSEDDCDLFFISFLNERGFSPNGAKAVSMIPLMREYDFELPPDDVLVKDTCRFLGIDFRDVPKDVVNWILNGEQDNDG
jgi:hypothetical protein